ncbi:hypothetical protein M1590_01900 [Candidatus Marsarchaeota archaeon]|nr:hypothetical protein [Candidatus Marsarchaeota archaeon]
MDQKPKYAPAPGINLRFLLHPMNIGLSEEGIRIQETARQNEVKMIFLDIFKFNSNNEYDNFQSALRNITYALTDIEILCPKIEINYNTGYFISAAINKIIKKGDTVTLDFNGAKVDHVAHYLQKGHVILYGPAGDYAGAGMSGSASLTINGPAGDSAGRWMSGSASLTINGPAGNSAGAGMFGSASLTINGPAGNSAGQGMFRSAKLTINGPVGDNAGAGMSDSSSLAINGPAGDNAGEFMSDSARLTIKQNAGNTVGVYSSGGTIEIEGDIGGIAYNCKAAVYHNGKRVKFKRLHNLLRR